jgi:hypothetical protein
MCQRSPGDRGDSLGDAPAVCLDLISSFPSPDFSNPNHQFLPRSSTLSQIQPKKKKDPPRSPPVEPLRQVKYEVPRSGHTIQGSWFGC